MKNRPIEVFLDLQARIASEEEIATTAQLGSRPCRRGLIIYLVSRALTERSFAAILTATALASRWGEFDALVGSFTFANRGDFAWLSSATLHSEFSSNDTWFRVNERLSAIHPRNAVSSTDRVPLRTYFVEGLRIAIMNGAATERSPAITNSKPVTLNGHAQR